MNNSAMRIDNSDEMGELDDQLLQELYMWVDQIPLTRPKRNITRDFSDGVLVAEVVKHYFPNIVDIHNYSPANNTKQKIENWYLLNRKVFKRLKFEVADEVIRQISTCRPWVIEHVLLMLRTKLERLLYKDQQEQQQPQPPTQRGHAQKQHPQNGMASSPTRQVQAQSHYIRPGQAQFTRNVAQHPQKPQSEPVAQYNANYPKPQQPQQQQFGYQNPGPMGNSYSNPGMKGGDRAIEEKEQELLAKDETIQILQAKVRRLEHLVHLKDIRIDELNQKVEQMSSQGTRTHGSRR